MSDLLQTVAAYVPPNLVRAVLHEAEPKPPTTPQTERFPAAVLFADVSGFTPLTEALGQKGSEGPEELTRLLNRYFSWMIAFVEAEGGEVVKFGGDALTVIFPAKGEALSVATRRALQAANTMQMAMQEFGIMQSSVGLVTLKMKIGIGAGEIISSQVGGVDNRWEYIIAGDPLRQTAQAEKQAKQGQIVLSPEAEAIVSPYTLPLKSLPQPKWDTAANPTAVVAALSCYAPKPVRIWLEQGLHSWMATLRPMSVLFAGVSGLDYQQPDVIEQLHTFLRGVQEIIYHYQGSLPRLTVDDKGTVLLILFGAPPDSHEDDPERALRCALDLQNLARNHNLELAIGVTTGRVFAGPVGSNSRREYTVMGDTVNLAARLMGVAGPGQVRCNYETYRSAYEQMSFETLPPVHVKGKSSPIAIYRPTGDSTPGWQLNQMKLDGLSGPMVGRKNELTKLTVCLDKIKSGQSCVLIVEGEAGIGKSKLVETLIGRMQKQGLSTLLGIGRSIEQETPYRVWQDIFSTYFKLNGASGPKQTAQQHQVEEKVTKIAPDWIQSLPLLNDILHLDIPENETSALLDNFTRRENLTALLLALLQARATQEPLALILENAQWLDPDSWRLAVEVAQNLMTDSLPLILVLAMRPLEEITPHAKTLSSMDITERLRLDFLPPEETLTLAVQSLGLSRNELPEAVAELLRIRASGNPYFAEELFYFLYDNEYITFKSMEDKIRCLISGDLDRAAQTLPATIQSVILSRIDQLPPDKQLMLKIGAVIGQTFAYNILRDTLNKHMEISEEQFKEFLDDLIHLDLIRPENTSLHLTYSFKHIIIQEVTYQSLLFDRRRNLHRTVAMWYETTFGQQEDGPENGMEDAAYKALILRYPTPESSKSPLVPYYPLLVYHWHQAEDDDREQHYAALLGEQAVAQFANAEAVAYINRALDLTAQNNLVGRYRLLLARETIYDRRGEREVQQQDLAALAGIAKEMKDSRREVVVTLRQAQYSIVTSKYPDALDAAKRVVDLARQANDPIGESKGYVMWSKILAKQGGFEKAKTILEQALTLIDTGNNSYDYADTLHNLARVDLGQGNYASAQTRCQEVLETCQNEGYPLIEAHSLNMAGLTHFQLGNYQEAQTYFEQATAIYYTIEDKRGESKPFYNLGLTHLFMGHHEAARDYFEYSLDTNRKINDQEGLADSLTHLGITYGKRGDYTTARSYLGQALGIYKEINNKIGEASALSNFGFVYYSLGDNDTTRRYCELALSIAQKIGNKKDQTYSLTYLGHALAGQEAFEDAITTYTKALNLHQEMELSIPPIDITAGIAYVNMKQGNMEQALVHIETVLNWIKTNKTGTGNLLWVYLKCFQVLNAAQENNFKTLEQAEPILNTAYTTLKEQTNALSHKKVRKNYLAINTHKEIMAIWKSKKNAGKSNQPSNNI